MTVIVTPSTSREVTHESLSATARWADADWIVPANEDINASDEGLAGAPLNAAAITTSATSLDVSIDTFEGFIGGAWLGSDDSTAAEHTHTLAGTSTTTTLYLGKDQSQTDTFLFGPASEFAAADPKIPIADVADDGSGVTDVDDRRPLGHAPRQGVLIASTYDADATTPLTLDTGALGETYAQYYVIAYKESHTDAEDYNRCRVNGSSSSNYQYDSWDANNNTGSGSSSDQTEWGKLMGTDAGANNPDGAGFCVQEFVISCPREIVSNGFHYPNISMRDPGVGYDPDYLMSGSFAVDSAAVSRINIFGGGAATGIIEIHGRGLGHGE
jgi:hypothetical protein